MGDFSFLILTWYSELARSERRRIRQGALQILLNALLSHHHKNIILAEWPVWIDRAASWTPCGLCPTLRLGKSWIVWGEVRPVHVPKLMYRVSKYVNHVTFLCDEYSLVSELFHDRSEQNVFNFVFSHRCHQILEIFRRIGRWHLSGSEFSRATFWAFVSSSYLPRSDDQNIVSPKVPEIGAVGWPQSKISSVGGGARIRLVTIWMPFGKRRIKGRALSGENDLGYGTHNRQSLGSKLAPLSQSGGTVLLENISGV